MIKKLATGFLGGIVAFVSLTGLAIIANAWTHGAVAQSVLTSLQVAATNSTTLSTSSSDFFLAEMSSTWDGTMPYSSGFDNIGTLKLNVTTTQGLNTNGGGTTAKVTDYALDLNSFNHAAGQRVNLINNHNCYGMGDCEAEFKSVVYASGPVNGDEGIGFGPVEYVRQQAQLDLATITTVTKTTCNTTTTQTITGGPTAQAVTVASTSGCNVGDWVVVNQNIASGLGTPTAEAVKLTAVGGGSITGVFRFNYGTTGITITPALDLVFNAPAAQWGQQRVLVNLSATPVSAGTVTAATGAAFTGSGTSWSVGMVGGTSTNIGCIELDNDTYTGNTGFGGFNGSAGTAFGPLKSWYQIKSVTSSTLLAIFSSSVAGDASYHGLGPGPAGSGGSSTYVIRPCIEILYVVSDKEIVTESTSTTWNVGDDIEEIIAPYPDVKEFQWHEAKWGPGGAPPDGIRFVNNGARTIANGMAFDTQMPVGGGADTVAFDNGFECGVCNIALRTQNSKVAAIDVDGGLFGTGNPDIAGKIQWHGTLEAIMPSGANEGLTIQMTGTGTGGLITSMPANIVGTGTLADLSYSGMIGQSSATFSALPTCSTLSGVHWQWITDSNTSTFNGAITAGGGSNKGFAVCQGGQTNWTFH